MIVICLVVLLVSGIMATTRAEFDTATAVYIFGPSGVIVSMAGRLLTVWDRATQLVMQREGS